MRRFLLPPLVHPPLAQHPCRDCAAHGFSEQLGVHTIPPADIADVPMEPASPREQAEAAPPLQQQDQEHESGDDHSRVRRQKLFLLYY